MAKQASTTSGAPRGATGGSTKAQNGVTIKGANSGSTKAQRSTKIGSVTGGSLKSTPNTTVVGATGGSTKTQRGLSKVTAGPTGKQKSGNSSAVPGVR